MAAAKMNPIEKWFDWLATVVSEFVRDFVAFVFIVFFLGALFGIFLQQTGKAMWVFAPLALAALAYYSTTFAIIIFIILLLLIFI